MTSLCPKCNGPLETKNGHSYCSSCKCYQMEFRDSIQPKASLVAHKPTPNEAIRIVDDDGRAISMDSGAQGQIDLSLTAKRRHNESGDSEVCRILVNRLNQDGDRWGDAVHVKTKSRDEAGVDGRARDGQRVLNIQVTRACADPNLWKRVDPKNPTQRALSDSAHADELRDAIAKKSTRPKEGIVLALDSIETPHVVLSVVESFRKRHGEWARSLGYQAIWLVGASPELSYRLDQDA